MRDIEFCIFFIFELTSSILRNIYNTDFLFGCVVQTHQLLLEEPARLVKPTSCSTSRSNLVVWYTSEPDLVNNYQKHIQVVAAMIMGKHWILMMG